MDNRIDLLFNGFTAPKRLCELLAFNDNGYLAPIGWSSSFISRSPVEQNNKLIPQVNYSLPIKLKTGL